MTVTVQETPTPPTPGEGPTFTPTATASPTLTPTATGTSPSAQIADVFVPPDTGSGGLGGQSGSSDLLVYGIAGLLASLTILGGAALVKVRNR